MKVILQDFLSFLRRPEQLEVVQPLNKKLKDSFLLWLACFVFTMVFVLAVDSFVELPTMDTSEIIKKVGIPVFIFSVLVLAPVVEEIIFRWPLRYSLTAAVITSIILFLSIVSGVNVLMETQGEGQEHVYFGIIGVVFILFVVFWILVRSKSAVLKRLWEGNFTFVFYFFSIAFALIHVLNYEDQSLRIWLLAPLLVLPQFVLGLVAGYSRMRFGMPYAVFVHFIHNAFVLMIYFLGQ